MEVFVIRNNCKGYTLIELAVVLIIIALLAVFAVPKIVDSVRDAEEIYAITEIKLLKSNLEKITRETGIEGLENHLKKNQTYDDQIDASEFFPTWITEERLYDEEGGIREFEDVISGYYHRLSEEFIEQETAGEAEGTFYLRKFKKEEKLEQAEKGINLTILFVEDEK